MTDDGSIQTDFTPIWPLPKFHFEAKLDSDVMSCHEVTGLNEAELRKITIKNAILTKDNKFWDWLNQTKLNTVKRVPLTISILDESNTQTMVWIIKNAYPTKITGTALKVEDSEITVETIEIAHEGITVRD